MSRPEGSRHFNNIYKKLHSFDLNSIIHGSLHFTSFATAVCIFERYHIVSMKLSEIKHGIQFGIFYKFLAFFRKLRTTRCLFWKSFISASPLDVIDVLTFCQRLKIYANHLR